MGQINTNNYPTVDSLADADLLIVENATHGTGTTTPKQLRENAIGTTPLQTTSQTVTGAINELKDEIDSEINFTLAGTGAKTSVVSDVVDTDIVLHRAPKVGDRILVYFDSKVIDPDYLKLYGISSSDPYTLSLGMHTPDYYLNGLCLFEVIDLMGINLALDLIYRDEYDAGTGISINNGTIANTMPQRGDNIKGYDITTDISSGILGTFSLLADYIILNFKANALPDGSGKYHAILTDSSGGVAIMKYAILKRLDGTFYNENIYTGMSLLCKSNDGGTGAEADPIVLTVINVYHTNEPKIDANGNVTASGHVKDGQGNDLASVAALEASASGNPIVVNAQGVAAKGLKVTLEPIQDLHGYDHSWAGGAGKNHFQTRADATWSDKGMNVTVNQARGTATIWGTYTGTGFGKYKIGEITLPAGTYKINGRQNALGTNNLTLQLFDESTSNQICNLDDSTMTYTFTLATQKTLDVYAGFRVGLTIAQSSPAVLTPMIYDPSESDTFEPYANECPITGRTQASVGTRGKNLLPLTLTGLKALNTQGTWADNVYTINTVTYTVYTDSADRVLSIEVNGTPNNTVQFFLSKSDLAFSTATLLSSGIAFNSNSAFLQGRSGADGSYVYYNADVNGVSVSANTALNHIYIAVASGKTANNVVVYPMLRDASISDNTYEPYTPTSVTYPFGQTVYGGKIKSEYGNTKLRVDRTLFTFSGASDEGWQLFTDGSKHYFVCEILSNAIKTPAPIASYYKGIVVNSSWNEMNDGECGFHPTNASIFRIRDDKYSQLSDFRTALTSNPLQVCYPLATPIEIDLTPATLELLKGYNYITADGDMDIVYIPESVLPTPPTTDGTYRLVCTVANGKPSFSWAAN